MAVWTIAQASEALREDRLDADYFKPDDLSHIQEALKAGGQALSNLAEIKNGRTPAFYEETEEVPVVRSGDLVTPLIFQGNGQAYLRTAQNRQHFSLKTGDVLISSIGMGSIGKVGIVLEQANFVTVSEVSVLRNPSVSPEFLFAYLSTPKGQAQIERQITGATGQQHLLKSKVGKIIIPKIGSSIQESVKKHVTLAAVSFSNAKKEYEEAEGILNAALDLDFPDLVPHLFYEDTFAHTAAVGRLDAEFFQPMYERLLEHLKATGQAGRLGDHLREPAKRGLQPIYDEDGTFTVINSQHVGSRYIDLETNRKTNTAQAERNKGKSILRYHDVLLNSTGYQTIGRAQTLLEDIPAVVDSHVTILRPKSSLDPVFLSVFLNGLPGFLQTEQNWTGSSGQIELRLEPIENYTVWLAPTSIQQEIRKHVEDAHAARQESRRLLDEAKRTVEAAILEKA